MDISYTELPYHRDAATLACQLSHLPGFAFLDSRKRRAVVGRYDIIAALPVATVQYDPGTLLDHWRLNLEQQLKALGPAGLAIGFIDYESGASALGVHRPHLEPATVGLYRWHVLQDHQLGKAWLVADANLEEGERNQIRGFLEAAIVSSPPFRLTAPFRPSTSEGDYAARVDRIRELIAAGDCYQVNYAHRFETSFDGDAFGGFLTLRDVAPGDFSAFLRLHEEHAILSLSPERFLSISGRKVTSQPIKGTRPRSTHPAEDARLARELRESTKDRAENIMITDLLRNDLGRYCEPGSVAVPELCVLHSYDNVHHLVSQVEGELRPDVTPAKVLVGCSPGGSITGAPKRRAMEVIRELESHSRGAYCGSVFALWADGRLQSSIAIRTFEAKGSQLICWGGGGIVHDSVPDAEYRETYDKIGGFMEALAPEPSTLQ